MPKNVPRFFSIRRSAAGLAPLAGLVLLLALVSGGLHHHADGALSHACAVCTASHAPAVTTVTQALGAPLVHGARVVLAPATHPRPIAVAASDSRAPPAL